MSNQDQMITGLFYTYHWIHFTNRNVSFLWWFVISNYLGEAHVSVAPGCTPTCLVCTSVTLIQMTYLHTLHTAEYSMEYNT